MAWYRGTGKENHKSVFENVSHDRCIFCGGDRTEIHSTDFTIYFSEFEYSTGSICKSCYHANAKQVKASNTIVQNVILIIVQCTIIRASRTPDQVEGP